MTQDTNTQGAAILCEHEDGRYAVNPDTTGDPARHRLGPVDISALAASAQSGLTDAYAGAREDLSIWKRRALEAERDLRSEKQTTSRLVGELNAANGPAYMGEPAASPAYGATEYGWADYRRLQDGDKRLIALVVNLYGNDHQSSSDLEGLLDRASRWQVPAQQPEATHLRELAAPSTDQVEEILRERDDADDFIDALLDEVLGHERPEWSSAYGRADALNDVRERMTALPESFLEIPDVQDESGINAYYSREVVLECIDAALASHGQALRLLTQKEKDSLGRRAEGMDGNEWDQWVQEKFAQVNGLKVQGGSYEWDWE